MKLENNSISELMLDEKDVFLVGAYLITLFLCLVESWQWSSGGLFI